MRKGFYIPVFLTALVLFNNCHQNNYNGQTLVIPIDTSALKLVNGYWNYQGKLFSGILKETYPTNELKSIQSITNGRQQGLAETFYPGGKPETWRWYTNGEKDSVHIGWWLNGNKKFEYHFNKGNYDGLFTEWYTNGQTMQQVLYQNGHEISGKGWRNNGKIYMNFIVKGGRYYGLMNSNLCYSLAKEQVQ